MKTWKATILIKEDGTSEVTMSDGWNGRTLRTAGNLLHRKYRHRKYENRQEQKIEKTREQKIKENVKAKGGENEVVK